MAGLTYTTYVAALAQLMVIEPTDTDFVAYLPNIINDAEQRIYRELDLLSTVVFDTSSSVTPNNPGFVLPTSVGKFIVVNSISVFTPVGATALNGTLNPLTPVTLDFLHMAWPSATGAGVPQLFAMVTDSIVRFGPWPDAAYVAQVGGTQRPTPLTVTNNTTFLSLYLPDLFLSASMVAGAAYQKNFGAMADNPQMAVSWESHYQTEFASANVEENRKKFASGAWGSLQPTPIATATR